MVILWLTAYGAKRHARYKTLTSKALRSCASRCLSHTFVYDKKRHRQFVPYSKNYCIPKIFFVSLQPQTASQSPVMGDVGGSATVIALALCLGKDIMESVYLTLFLGLLKLRNFLIVVKNVANGRCLSGYVFSVRTRRESVGYGRIAYFRVRLCAFARSTTMGNAKASTSVNEQTVRLSRFFFINQSIANEGSPAAR